MKKLWEILVPTVFNDGRPIKLKYHRVWDAEVRKISGGLTIQAPAKGQWVSDDGTIFKERMIPVRILATAEEMQIVVDFTIDHYEQIAVLAYVISENVIFKHATDEVMATWPTKNKAGHKNYDWIPV